MLEGHSRGERLVLAAAVLILMFVAFQAMGAGGCRATYPYSPNANTYSNTDYCASYGGIWLIRSIVDFVHDSRDDIAAVSTVILAAFTVVLAYAARRQAILTREIVDAAISSANTAERALTELEAPHAYIQVRTSGITVRITNGFRSIEFGNLLFDFINYGRTPSHITEFFTDIQFSEGGAPPPIIDINTVNRTILPWGVVAAPNGGRTKEYIHNIPPLFIEGRPAFFINETEILYFLGFFRYTDIFGGRYVSGFCFLFNRTDNSFIRAGGDEYNYRRKET